MRPLFAMAQIIEIGCMIVFGMALLGGDPRLALPMSALLVLGAWFTEMMIACWCRKNVRARFFFAGDFREEIPNTAMMVMVRVWIASSCIVGSAAWIVGALLPDYFMALSLGQYILMNVAIEVYMAVVVGFPGGVVHKVRRLTGARSD